VRNFWLIFIIFSLIISTTLIKNSTKKIEDEIFSTEESLRVLNLNYNDVLLEHNYLSSSEKLLEFQSLYFDNELSQKNIKEIKILIKKDNEILIKNLEAAE
jgi:hypothetical protein